jgi:hypothetical protein
MPHLEQQGEQYIDQLLVDLNLANLQGKEKGEVVEMLRSRFAEVVFNTTVRLLPEDLKVEYIKAASDPDANEKRILEITSQVPELAEGIEAALLFELEALKHSMGK